MKHTFSIIFLLLLFSNAFTQYLITTPDSLKNNAADYVIITHQDFTESLQPLCKLRDSLDFTVKMAEAPLIYSTFNGTDKSGDIKEFIQNAYDTWTQKPKYILLVGDASRNDDKNNFIPSRQRPKFSFHYLGNLRTHASDNWYVQLDGDDFIPEIAIGRLPVNSVESCRNWVKKIVAYEQINKPADWRKRVALIVSQDYERKYSKPLIDKFFTPHNILVHKVYESMGSSSNQIRQRTIDAFDKGAFLMFAITHGSTTPQWRGSKTLFHYQDLSKLKNTVFPIVIGRGWYDGYYDRADRECLEEQISESAINGSIASGAYSTCGTQPGSHAFAIEVCEALFNDKVTILGDLIRIVKKRIITNNTSDQVYGPAVLFTLFGDPALKIKYKDDPSHNFNTLCPAKKHTLFTAYGQRLRFHQPGKLTIYSIAGQRLIHKSIQKQESITLRKGIYIFKFVNKALHSQACQNSIVVLQ